MGFQNLLNSEKGRLRSLRQQETKRMRILKTAELEMKAIFINCILATTTFLSFDIRTTVGPPEVYLQNLKSLTYQLLRQKVLKPSKSAIFTERCPKEYVFDVYEKEKRQKNYTKNMHPNQFKLYIFISVRLKLH